MHTRRSLILGLSGLPLASAAAHAQGPSLLTPAGFSAMPPIKADAQRARMAPLKMALAKGRFIAYHPTGIAIWNGRARQADEASLTADLSALRPWFDGLITYGARNGTERVPDIAKRLGYRAVIQGVWNPADVEEIERALAVWRRHPDLVVGLSLGNEVVLSRRGTWGDLGFALRRVRALAPGLPLAATEPFAQFLNDPEALSTLQEMDFLLANVHPIFENWFFGASPQNWAGFVVQVADQLRQRFPGPVVIKETGVPSGPAASGYTPQMQRDFYRALSARLAPGTQRAFAYFGAFDLPWAAYNRDPATHQVFAHEAHWGLFDAQRQPKPVVNDLVRIVTG